MDDTVVLEPAPDRQRRRVLVRWIGLLVIPVALLAVAVVAARGPAEPVAALEHDVHAPTSPPGYEATPDSVPAVTTVPVQTTTTLTVTSAVERPRKKQTMAEYIAEYERENRCVPGTFRTTAREPTCMHDPSSVDGRVVDLAGQPIAGACVTSLLPAAVSLRTDTEGRYSIVSGAGGGYRYSTCAGTLEPFVWVPVTRWQPSLAPGEHVQAEDVVLQRSGGVRGRVVDPEGRPVAGVCVSVPTVDESVSAPSGADGSFAMVGVVPGTQRIGFQLCATVGIWDPIPDVVVRPGEWTEVTLTIQPGQRFG